MSERWAWRVILVAVAAGCRPVVPPADPGTSPADADAAASAWRPAPDPTKTSAFEGETLADEHAHHHHHGGHAPAKKDGGAATDGPKESATTPSAKTQGPGATR